MVMRGLRARLGAGGLVLFGALTLVTLSAPAASADSRVDGHATQVSGLKVQIYSQMCDNDGPNLHTRLAIRNTSSAAKQVLVHDTYARTVYDPPGPIPPGKGMLVHLTSSRRTPTHTLTLASSGQTETLTVPRSPCTTTTTTSTTKPHGSTTTTTGKGTTTTSKTPTSSVIPATAPPADPGDPGDPGVNNNVVSMAGSVPQSSAVKAAATGTLPFTGSDLRTFAVIGNLLVLIGFGMLYLSHRSPKTAALLARVRPGRNTSL
jgi:hypothetical protein